MPGRFTRLTAAALAALAVALGLAAAGSAHAAGPATTTPLRGSPATVQGCPSAASRSVACENQRPGLPASAWQVRGAGDQSIQGFATEMSVDVGQTVSFKIKTPATSYHVEILRMGYYQGNGARLVASLHPSAALPQRQPACLTDPGSGLMDCGNWTVSASWSVPSSAVSGVYLAHLVRNDTGGSSQIPFVVRDDSSTAAVQFQTSDETWQAYNTYGGNSLYQCHRDCPAGDPGGYKGASKVSYNRPFHSALDDLGRDWVMAAEYPMIRFLESNGYDVSYVSGLDVATGRAQLQRHRVFMSVGHDEYWSGDQRANVEAARDHGVNLAFFSGNEVFWKTRWEPSIDATHAAGRTLVCYKETHYDSVVDPQDPQTWTGTWQDPRFSPPADGGRPQNALTGQLFKVNAGTTDIDVPYQYSGLRIWRATAAARLRPGQQLTLAPGVGTLGYEWDETVDNGVQPAGLFAASETHFSHGQVFTDYGTTVAALPATHHLSMYRAPSGALVFGAGTVQWSWGLDGSTSGKPADPTMRQATVNLLADMSAQPATLAGDLSRADRSTDVTPPRSHITSPVGATHLSDGTALTITGTATDADGVVAGVEVSTDGGRTWHPAEGTKDWTYSWVAHGSPSTTIETRAVDDSGNLEKPAEPRTVFVDCPCSLWGTGWAPARADSGQRQATSVGMTFTSSVFGTITAIRFYKSPANTGHHTGNLWTASGSPLAHVDFSHETASGWQQASLARPVPVLPNVAVGVSYFAPHGHYSFTPNVLDLRSVLNGPLTATRATIAAPNGQNTATVTDAFPATGTQFGAAFGVDVLFTAAPVPGAPREVAATVADGATTVSWRPPSSGGPITKYVVTPVRGGKAERPIIVTGDTSGPAGVQQLPTSVVAAGLASGGYYRFVVTAANPNGAGPASALSASVAAPSGSPISLLLIVAGLVVFLAGAALVVVVIRDRRQARQATRP